MFATNSLTILPEVDVIVVMKEGRIQETGTYETLKANGGEFAKLLTEHTKETARQEATGMEGTHTPEPFDTQCCHMGTAVKHPVPDRGLNRHL